MKNMTVKDLMLPLKEYPTVGEDATLLDAITALETHQKALPAGRQPHRAVLAVDRRGHVVGKIGQLAFLKALEVKVSSMGDRELLAKAGLSAEMISTMAEYASFWNDNLDDICRRARAVHVKETLKVDAERLDKLVDTIGELVIAESMVSQSKELQQVVSPQLSGQINHLDKITRELQEMGMSLRMVPVRSRYLTCFAL